MNNKELGVIVKAKDLCSYVMTVTQKSPKQYRFTFTTRLNNLAMDIIQNLYLANDTFVGGENAKNQWEKRLSYQQEAMTKTRLLSYFALLAMEQKVILPKQYHVISVRAYEVMQTLTAWVRSDKKRFEKK